MRPLYVPPTEPDELLEAIAPKGQVIRLPEPVVRPLPRVQGPVHKPERYRATLFQALRRLLAWYLFFIRYTMANAKGDKAPQARAQRLRTMLQDMGISGVKVGQQMAVRMDILPLEYVREMEKLLDEAPPMATAVALTQLEASLGKPLGEIFHRIDPKPIGSASLACVYRAILHDGRRVAVKVRRPGVAVQLAADMRALRMLGGFIERVGLMRKGVIVPAVEELQRMLIDELDFVLESRQIIAFGRDIEHLKGISVPEVHFELCRPDVLVTEFIEGMSMREIIAIVESRDIARLADLAARGYQPRKLCRRWLRFFYWQAYDAVLFHADPHPGNILVRPGNKLVLIDFGTVGTIAGATRKNMLGFQRATIENDIDGLVRYTIAMGEPLPPLDIETYRAEIRNVMREQYVVSRCAHVPWQERAFGNGLQKLSEVMRKHHIGMPPDQLRYLRASNLSDAMVYRLDPDLDVNKEFGKWYREREEAERKRLEEDPTDPNDPLQVERKLRLVEKGVEHLADAVAQHQHRFRERPSRSAHSIGLLMRFFASATLLLTLVALVTLPFTADRFFDHWLRVAAHPVSVIGLLGLGLIFMQRILNRLDELF